MTMTVGELIAELESYDECLEVRLAMQPSWAMEYTISQVGCSDPTQLTEDHKNEIRVNLDEEAIEAEENGSEFNRSARFDEMRIEYLEAEANKGKDEEVVYLAEGSQLGYLPTQAAEAVGWR